MSSFDFDEFLPKSWLEDGLSLRQAFETVVAAVGTVRKGVKGRATIAIAASAVAMQMAFIVPSTLQTSGQLRLFDSHPTEDTVVYSGEDTVPKEFWPALIARIDAMPKLADDNDDADIPYFL